MFYIWCYISFFLSMGYQCIVGVAFLNDPFFNFSLLILLTRVWCWIKLKLLLNFWFNSLVVMRFPLALSRSSITVSPFFIHFWYIFGIFWGLYYTKLGEMHCPCSVDNLEQCICWNVGKFLCKTMVVLIMYILLCLIQRYNINVHNWKNT